MTGFVLEQALVLEPGDARLRSDLLLELGRVGGDRRREPCTDHAFAPAAQDLRALARTLGQRYVVGLADALEHEEHGRGRSPNSLKS